MVHNLSNAIFLTVAKVSARSRTSRSTKGYTWTNDRFLVLKAAAKASEPKVICSTMKGVTLTKSKSNLIKMLIINLQN